MTKERGLHFLALLTSLSTLGLLCAGALVTSTDSGLAVPDWPLANGQFFPPMEGAVLYEHGHRLYAGSVALLTVLLAALISKFEGRRWVRTLGFVAVGMVLAQALLGGLTVLLQLPPGVSIAHACLAQLFFCTTVVLAIVLGTSWQSHQKEFPIESEAGLPIDTHCLIVTLVFFLQLLMGATMRHFDAGLAITDLPMNLGAVLPVLGDPSIAIHFAHRMGAYILVALVVSLTIRIHKNYSDYLSLVGWSGAMVSFVAIQIVLGFLTIWLRRPVPITMLHLAVGALCLASSVGLTLHAYRLRFLALIGPRPFIPAEPLPA